MYRHSIYVGHLRADVHPSGAHESDYRCSWALPIDMHGSFVTASFENS